MTKVKVKVMNGH